MAKIFKSSMLALACAFAGASPQVFAQESTIPADAGDLLQSTVERLLHQAVSGQC